MKICRKCRYQPLVIWLLSLLIIAISGCSSDTQQGTDNKQNDFCSDVTLESVNLEIVQGENELIILFDVPLICCHHVLVELYYEGEYLDHWISPYDFGGGHQERVTFAFENGYLDGTYQIRIETGNTQIFEEFQIE